MVPVPPGPHRQFRLDPRATEPDISSSGPGRTGIRHARQVRRGFRWRGWSGRRGSNSRHSAWKADALPTELLPPEAKGKVPLRSGLTVGQPRRGCACQRRLRNQTGQPRHSEPRHGQAPGSRHAVRRSLPVVPRRPRAARPKALDDRPLPLQHRAVREVARRQRRAGDLGLARAEIPRRRPRSRPQASPRSTSAHPPRHGPSRTVRSRPPMASASRAPLPMSAA